MADPAHVSAAMQRLRNRLEEGGDIDTAEAEAMADAAAMLEYIGRHRSGLRVLLEALRVNGTRSPSDSEAAALAALPEVKAVLDTFPGSAVSGIRS